MVQGTEPASDKAPVTVVDETRQPPPAATSPAPLPSLAGLDDAQFAGAAQEINDRTIRLSQLGESKSSAGGVGRFAHELATSHLALQTRLRMAENRASIAPDDSSLCSVLKSSAQREVTALTSVSGPDFDRYYVDAEVRQQQESLDLLDKMLQQMMTPALRHELQEMRGHIAAHLRSAEALRQDLQKR